MTTQQNAASAVDEELRELGVLVLDHDPEVPCCHADARVATHDLVCAKVPCLPHPICLPCAEGFEALRQQWADARDWECRIHGTSFTAHVDEMRVIPRGAAR